MFKRCLKFAMLVFNFFSTTKETPFSTHFSTKNALINKELDMFFTFFQNTTNTKFNFLKGVKNGSKSQI